MMTLQFTIVKETRVPIEIVSTRICIEKVLARMLAKTPTMIVPYTGVPFVETLAKMGKNKPSRAFYSIYVSTHNLIPICKKILG